MGVKVFFPEIFPEATNLPSILKIWNEPDSMCSFWNSMLIVPEAGLGVIVNKSPDVSSHSDLNKR